MIKIINNSRHLLTKTTFGNIHKKCVINNSTKKKTKFLHYSDTRATRTLSIQITNRL